MNTLLNQSPDCGQEFHNALNTFFQLQKVNSFDPEKGEGTLFWQRHGLKTRMSFNQMSLPYERVAAWEFPAEYGEDKTLPFDLSFYGDRIIRLRISGRDALPPRNAGSEILEHLPKETGSGTCQQTERQYCYKGKYGSVTIQKDPFEFELQDADGKTLTHFVMLHNQQGLVNDTPVPTSIVRKADDLRRMLSITLSMEPGERFVGCGESFTKVDKRGQKLNMWSCDPKGVMGREMYKPVPFFISSRGYGLFVHNSTPGTFDFGSNYDGALNVFLDAETADLFFFIGTPREILDSYTMLTGKSPLPPLWSFGLWMSRCSYRTQEEVLEVAEKMRQQKVPCDVIHIDTGWFETNWRCDFRFSPSRFPQAEEMLQKLKNQNYHVSLWMLPYFNPNNDLYQTLIEKGYAVRGIEGSLPTEDAVVDFSNQQAVDWFRQQLKPLFDMGVSALKTDFGEGAPAKGLYASGASGKTEHNLYPVRYQKAIYDITKEMRGEGLIWARAGWAGAQRYPVHWGGDSESTNGGLAASIRGGISLGASGFTYWSHDIGGFCKTCPEELYLRWLAFGAFSSHARCHGQTPKEPWTMSPAGQEMFRKIVEARYKLLPYIYTQAAIASERGLPLLRGMFIDYPEDPLAWTVEDAYLFGDDMLVAPLLSDSNTRNVYLPRGEWVDYQTGIDYDGGKMYSIQTTNLPILLFVKKTAAIPLSPVVQCTEELDWSKVYFQTFSDDKKAEGRVLLPDGSFQAYKTC